MLRDPTDKNTQGGFSLPELLIVIVILTSLTALVFPLLTKKETDPEKLLKGFIQKRLKEAITEGSPVYIWSAKGKITSSTGSELDLENVEGTCYIERNGTLRKCKFTLGNGKSLWFTDIDFQI